MSVLEREARGVLDLSAGVQDDPLTGYFLHCHEPDAVVETILPGGRRIYLHSFLSRVLQRAYVDALTESVERVLLDGVHGHRPGRSRTTALHQVGTNIAAGYVHLWAGDIRRFFKSVTMALLDVVLRRQTWLGRRMRGLALWFLSPPVLRRPTHPDRRRGEVGLVSRAPGYLLEGGVISPVLANLVAHEVLDTRLTEESTDVKCVRYADDFLIMGQTPASCDRARTIADAALREVGLACHGEQAGVRDVRRRPVSWLGMLIHGGVVRTPSATMSKMEERLLAEDPESPEFVDRCWTALDLLSLGDACRRRIDYLARRVSARSPEHGESLGVMVAEHRRRRREHDPHEFAEDIAAAYATGSGE